MSIIDLSLETVEQLCSALEKGPTLDWKVLMRRRFCSVYSENDIAEIERTKGLHPAKALLDYLDTRQITLQELLEGLIAIGNKKAASILMQGRGCFFLSFFL